ncbi:MAG: hypothetical protein LBM98_00050 [Oscillospiraceae bacterium]|nr:hypothetical protein [Oscillospiraceae bacterium]
MLRTCNVLRIASVPVLRNDGRGKPRPRARRVDADLDEGTGLGLLRAARNDGAPGRWTGLRSAHGAGRAGLKPAPTSPPQPPAEHSSQISEI